jgi:hypothetical protein
VRIGQQLQPGKRRQADQGRDIADLVVVEHQLLQAAQARQRREIADVIAVSVEIAQIAQAGHRGQTADLVIADAQLTGCSVPEGDIADLIVFEVQRFELVRPARAEMLLMLMTAGGFAGWSYRPGAIRNRVALNRRLLSRTAGTGR